MFPLTHFYFNKQICSRVNPLLALGGIWPDLSSGCGMDRELSHYMGREFLAYCRKHHPQYTDFALGVLLHGSTPEGVDFYADQCWQNRDRGWCFQKAVQYIPMVAKATGLPENYVWWKSHNFVEIAIELLTNDRFPDLSGELSALTEDKASHTECVNILKSYTPDINGRTEELFGKIKEIFVIDDISADSLAENQAKGLEKRFGLKSDRNELKNIFIAIIKDIKDEYPGFCSAVLDKIRTSLTQNGINPD